MRVRLEEKGQISFHCPGCKQRHFLKVEGDLSYRSAWNGSVNTPTVTGYHQFEHNGGVCHLNLDSGRVQFLLDSNHELAGKTVTLPLLGG